jgi:hypothetical protein
MLKGDGSITADVGLSYPVWCEYKERLDWLEKFSSRIHVGISRSSGRPVNSKATDPWDCEWIYPLDSLDGIVTRHPIANWADLASYKPPDADAFTDWEKTEEKFAEAKANGTVARGGTDHGFVFLRMTYLRGYNDFMTDVGEGDPRLFDLIKIIEDYWFGVAKRYVEAGADLVSFGDDLGLQDRLPISPSAWRKYIKPTYMRIFQYLRSNGVYVHLHTDGYIVDIIPDLLDCGVSILNPQELVNGLDTLRDLARGKVFLDLDIDRQSITPFGTPQECEQHIASCVKTLGSPNGGLHLVWGVYPHTPYKNIEATVRAMSAYAEYWKR